MDYSLIHWSEENGVPYFDLNGSNTLDVPGDYLLGNQIPTMFGKHIYSAELLQALSDNGLSSNWPKDLTDPETAAKLWPERSALTYYPLFKNLQTDLHVMLLFGARDHVQPAPDKPHIHQAYDAFRTAGFWTRLNPDKSYVEVQDEKLSAVFQEHSANTEPKDWSEALKWGYTEKFSAIHLIPLAALAEMADRTHAENWSDDLSNLISK